MKSLLREIEDKFSTLEKTNDDELEEANVTGNIDGGEGPVKTPKAFAKSDDEERLDDDHIEVLGYKRTAPKRNNTKLESLESKMEALINELSYNEFKKDESRKDYQKINDSIKMINRMMFEMERVVNQNVKLKTEQGVSNEKYWKSTRRRFTKISERILKVATKLKELGA